MLFTIIMPNYNNARYLNRLFNSLKEQTCQDFRMIFVDDVSTDSSVEIANAWRYSFFNDRLTIVPLQEKRYNGGARNVALKLLTVEDEYVMFIDTDDYFNGPECLATIKHIIEQNCKPDCVRLSYVWDAIDEQRDVILNQKTPAELAADCNVACWTKCIKRELFQPFPENTLMEDVIQHLKQVDYINTVVPCKVPIVRWNRSNPNSCSTNTTLQNSKWISSFYRYYADLLDLQLEKSYTKEQRDIRIATAKENMKNSIYAQ